MKKKFTAVITGTGQIFNSHQQNCLTFCKNVRDNRGNSIFRITSGKLLYFCKVSASNNRGRSHQQNCLIFPKILPREYRRSSNIQPTSLNLGYFCEHLSSCYQRQVKFSSHVIKTIFILEAISAGDNRGSINQRVISSKLPYFCESFSSL